MSTKNTNQIKPTRGGAHNVKPPHLRRVQIAVGLKPDTLETLQPYTEASLRGKVIDLAVSVLLGNLDLDQARERVQKLLEEE